MKSCVLCRNSCRNVRTEEKRTKKVALKLILKVVDYFTELEVKLFQLIVHDAPTGK